MPANKRVLDSMGKLADLTANYLREAKFQLMCGKFGGELNRAPEVADSVGRRCWRKTAIDQLHQKTRAGAERGDFVVPATQHVVSVIIIWIQLERSLGVIADQA